MTAVQSKYPPVICAIRKQVKILGYRRLIFTLVKHLTDGRTTDFRNLTDVEAHRLLSMLNQA